MQLKQSDIINVENMATTLNGLTTMHFSSDTISLIRLSIIQLKVSIRTAQDLSKESGERASALLAKSRRNRQATSPDTA